uniref:Fucosyltransferase n=1 Tax=Anopheles farauti TaxID=69004 RepID=A0A182QLS1_9DIPT
MGSTMYRKHLLSLIAALVTFYLFLHLIVYDQCLKASINSYQLLSESNQARARQLEEESLQGTSTRYILLYTTFFAEEHWGLPDGTLGPDYFAATHCPSTDCVLTNDPDLIRPFTSYDAVVFHVASPWDRPLPALRHPAQVYVAALMESPAHTKHKLSLDNNYFNWTMTYRLDSDVLFNYLNIVDLESGEVIAPAVRPSWRNGYYEFANDSLTEIVSGKRKMAAQFVSHCGALSGRDRLVERMQQAGLEVDVYGACGTLKCKRGNPECNRMLDTLYWFYLSFENSLCVDYVTEKLYNALEHNIVPVVFGGADYNRFMPPGSYINVQDYATVEELSTYLLYLRDNPHEYVKYFWWKQHYALERTQPFCDLCKKLHTVGTREKIQYYRDIKAWWYDDVCTAKPKIEF